MQKHEEHHYVSILLAVLLFCAASCAVLAVATKAFGNTINLPYVARSRQEPTIIAATSTPWVSIGGPYVPPTQTPTITPAPRVQP